MSDRIIFGAERLDEARLAEGVGRTAGALEAEGIGAGDTVALLFRNDVPFALLSLAAARLGAAILPINWHFSADEVAYVLADSSAKLLIGHADLLLPLEGIAPDTRRYAVATPDALIEAYRIDRRRCVMAEDRDWSARVASAPIWTGAPRPSPLTMLYTSGTTGRPKGVRRPPLDAEAQKRVAVSMAYVFGSRSGMRTLAAAPLYHSAPNAVALSTLRTGGTLIIQPRFDAEQFLRLVAEHKATHAYMVPTMFVRLLRLPQAVRDRYDVGSLEWIVHSAAPCPPDVKRAMIEWLGDRIYDYYGATELGPITRVSAAEWLNKPGTLGRPVPGAEIRIYSPDGRRLGAGEPGEIYARNVNYPDFTYHKQDERRSEVGRDGLVTCGDVGYLDEDGFLFLSDRRRDMIISGGVNIYPAEIEAALALMPGVADAAVFGIPDPEFGESVCAYIQPLQGSGVNDDAVRAFLRERLAGYKVPRRIEMTDSLPREESGKIMKRKLRDPYWANTARSI